MTPKNSYLPLYMAQRRYIDIIIQGEKTEQEQGRITEHTYIHTYIHAYIHTYMHTNDLMHTYIHTHTYDLIHTCIYTYDLIHTYIYTYDPIHTYIHTYLHMIPLDYHHHCIGWDAMGCMHGMGWDGMGWDGMAVLL